MVLFFFIFSALLHGGIMIEDLENLKQLQEIDLRIHEQELAQKQFPDTVEELEGAIKKAKESLENYQTKLNKTQAEVNSLDDHIQKSRDLLEKSQSKLNSIKTNREYDAVHAEIENQKNSINSVEIRKKNLLDEIEKLNNTIEEKSKEYQQIKSENEPQISELKKKIAAIDSVIAGIVKERNEIAPKISKPILRTYDLIRKKRKNGNALSSITGKTCAVCYKVLEPQLYNEIKRGRKMLLCQNCGSIFVWGGDSKE